MALWHWIVGGAAAYMLLKRKVDPVAVAPMGVGQPSTTFTQEDLQDIAAQMEQSLAERSISDKVTGKLLPNGWAEFTGTTGTVYGTGASSDIVWDVFDSSFGQSRA